MMKNLLLGLAVVFLGFIMLIPASASAYNLIDNGGGVCTEAPDSPVCQGATANSSSKGDPVTQLIGKITKLVSIIAGIIAVILIIASGLKFVTSGGNEQKVAGAKNTLMNAVIGVAIIALASAIISFVMSKI